MGYRRSGGQRDGRSGSSRAVGVRRLGGRWSVVGQSHPNLRRKSHVVSLLVIGSIIGYFVVGAFYARSQAVKVWAEAYEGQRRTTPSTRFADLAKEWDRRDRDRANRDMRERLLWRAVFWPFALPYNAIRGPLFAWSARPVIDRQQRAAQLRADARNWDRLRDTGTPTEKAMAAELADMCRDRAKEIDL